jgi:PTH1 family peptidyl-tRNA hydrolase
MNLSGKAVNYYMQSQNITSENILVLTDDLALPFGALRMRVKGSDGGHNGLKNIIQSLNSPKFTRIKFGVGDEFSKGKQVDYVLGEWSDEEQEKLNERTDKVIEMIQSFVISGASNTMTLFNGK